MPDDAIATASAPAAPASDAGVVGAKPAATVAKPGETGKPAGKPEGALPAEVHPAVLEERQRAQKYLEMVSEVYVLDDQGQPIGVRPELVEKVRAEIAQRVPAAPAVDQQQEKERAIAQYAAETGLLPEQIRFIFDAATAVAEARINEANEPLVRSSVDSVKAGILASGEVPADAVPFVTRWIDEAYKINPRALLTQKGRETALRQALGDFLLSRIRERRKGVAAPRVANAPAGAPMLQRPRPGSSTGTPSSDEQNVRAKLGLKPAYTENTPTEG